MNGWFEPKVIVPVLALAVSGFIAWGATQQSVADHTRRLDKLESLAVDIADLRAQVRFLVRAEERRQGSRGGE